MDPLSITATVITLTIRCTETSNQLCQIFRHYRQAPQTIANLAEETRVIKASLSQVERALQRNPDGLSTPDLADIFDIAVKGCRATLLCLEEEFEKLKDREDWRARVLTLWNEDAMKGLVEQLGRKKATLALLIQGLLLQSSVEIQQLVRSGRPDLDSAKDDIASLIPRYPSVAIPLLESIDRTTIDSLSGSRNSVISTTEFAFDDAILNTRVYRETLARLVAAKRTPSVKSECTPTLEGDLIDLSDDVPMTTATTVNPANFKDLDGLRISSNSNGNLGEQGNIDLGATVSDRPLGKSCDDTSMHRHASEASLRLSDISAVCGGSDVSSIRSGISTAAINDPNLLSAFEDSTKRFILPEPIALKEEQKMPKNRSRFDELTRDSKALAGSLEDLQRVSKSTSSHIATGTKPIIVSDDRDAINPSDRDSLTSMANLASIHWNQERWNEAEELYIQIVETRKKVLGQEHQDTLTSIANLASIYYKQERLEEAEELFVQVIEPMKRVLGQEHQETLTSIATLASISRKQERWEEAKELFVQVIEPMKRLLGQEHRDTLASIANLASIYCEQGRWKEAEELFVQVIEPMKRVLGQEHRTTLTGIASLTSIYCEQERWEEAEELFLQVIEPIKRVLGQEHQDTLISIATLASISCKQERWEEAEELFVQVIEPMKRLLGQEHRDTLASIASLTSIYCEQGRWKEAEELFVQVETHKSVLDTEHPDTLTSLANLASTDQNQERRNEAKEVEVLMTEPRKNLAPANVRLPTARRLNRPSQIISRPQPSSPDTSSGPAPCAAITSSRTVSMARIRAESAKENGSSSITAPANSPSSPGSREPHPGPAPGLDKEDYGPFRYSSTQTAPGVQHSSPMHPINFAPPPPVPLTKQEGSEDDVPRSAGGSRGNNALPTQRETSSSAAAQGGLMSTENHMLMLSMCQVKR